MGKHRVFPHGGGGFLTGPSLTVWVPGVPRPQGSMQAIVSKSTGKAFMKQNPSLAEWRNLVVIRVTEEIEASSWEPVVDAPVYLQCNFYFARPKSHTKRQRLGDGGLKWNGSDLDKLVRGIGDALSIAGVYEDDRQVASLSARKFWTDELDEQGATIAVTRMATPASALADLGSSKKRA